MTNLSFSVDIPTLVQTFSLAFFSFTLSMILTPLYTTLAYKYEWWKRGRTTAHTGEKAAVFQKLHGDKLSRNIPTMAGVIFVISTILITIVANLSRSQTWLPLAAMSGAGLIGLLDDVINIRGIGGGIAGMRAKTKSVLLFLVALTGGWWFFDKLDVSSIHIPFYGAVHIGWLIVPLFMLVVISTANAVNISDGLDGLAGGLATTAFGAYAIIAAFEGRFGVAGFCLTVVGALLSYTWFNIFPARFFMGDVGSFALGTALGVVAMVTDTVLILPIIGLVFVVEAGSSLLRIYSKKLRHVKKIFKIAPIHHYFEGSGWPETKVTIRFWIVGQICAVLGILVYLIGKK